MRQVLAIKWGIFCTAGKLSSPAMIKKNIKKVLGSCPKSKGMGKEIKEPRTIISREVRMAKEVTPDGVQLRWHMFKSFCVLSADTPETFIFRILSPRAQDFSYQEYEVG